MEKASSHFLSKDGVCTLSRGFERTPQAGRGVGQQAGCSAGLDILVLDMALASLGDIGNIHKASPVGI